MFIRFHLELVVDQPHHHALILFVHAHNNSCILSAKKIRTYISPCTTTSTKTILNSMHRHHHSAIVRHGARTRDIDESKFCISLESKFATSAQHTHKPHHSLYCSSMFIFTHVQQTLVYTILTNWLGFSEQSTTSAWATDRHQPRCKLSSHQVTQNGYGCLRCTRFKLLYSHRQCERLALNSIHVSCLEIGT